MKVKKYEGAGFLFFDPTPQGGEILLGKRTPKPSGVWSIPGGIRKDRESYWECALRETCSEFGAPNTEFLLDERYFATDETKVTLIQIPFVWEYRTYLSRVKEKPENWPSPNWKFSAVGWFPLAKPIPDLHFTVKHTVRNFRRSGLIP